MRIARGRAAAKSFSGASRDCRAPARGASEPSEAGANEQPLGAIVPDLHAGDLAASHEVAVHVAVALERRAVEPFAVQLAGLVDDRFLGRASRDDVRRAELLLDPLVARLVERGRFGGVVHQAIAGKADLQVRGAELPRRIRVRDHVQPQVLLDDFHGIVHAASLAWPVSCYSGGKPSRTQPGRPSWPDFARFSYSHSLSQRPRWHRSRSRSGWSPRSPASRHAPVKRLRAG